MPGHPWDPQCPAEGLLARAEKGVPGSTRDGTDSGWAWGGQTRLQPALLGDLGPALRWLPPRSQSPENSLPLLP